MMPSLSNAVFGLLGLASVASAAPEMIKVKRNSTSQSGCTKFFFPVTASAMNLDVQNVPANFLTPRVLEAFIVSGGEQLAGSADGGVGRTFTNGTFEMSAIYCKPTVVVAKRANTVQYLQHAITMRKEYWNGLTYPVGFGGDDTYSYMATARANGYHTFAMDNLGNGESEHPDGISVTQQVLQVEIIHRVLQRLRNGNIGGPVGNKKFSKLIYAGHSYGSICGNGIATHHPADVDAFILTGYSARFDLGGVPLGAGLPIPANQVHPKFANLPDTYLADSYEKGRSFGLMTSPNSLGGFTPKIAQYDFKNEGTGAIGELATLLYGVGPADDYTGNVLVITGRRDAIVCNIIPGMPDCGVQSDHNNVPARAGVFFPNAKDYTVHIPLDTGHSANLHYSSPKSFTFAMSYLASKGY